ncbi:hypothetical protein C5167_015160 [Papaver somniferum]|uniref:Uncharacterized protein n=1 Tax=Papaver somniferum TaxID=3469 RepID=A0A4Y7J9A4_PAPSO|nr:CRIB domain-containing protein RIC4-like [Papaver somniferum]RZC56299.1 hypothetical protein C5167_015160 [Papaver somniferum]
MRSRIERLVILPFSIGCVSQSSVAVVDDPKKSKLEREQSEKEDESSTDGEEVNTKNSTLAKPNISLSFYKLIKNFKNLSQLFAYKEDDDIKMDMEIGFPTDVKHVTQIGWDGNNSKATTIIKGCSWDNNENNLNPLELFSSIPCMDSLM